MPNWCYNHLSIEGSEKDISAVKSQLNMPFDVMHDNWDPETRQMEKKLFTYSNPVFAFWNIIKPTNLEAYHGPQPELDLSKGISFDSDHWYDWNVRNWGTKWDVAVGDDNKYPETEITDETKNSLGYRLNTAWSPPAEAIAKLSKQYPDLVFTLSFEEETGWGGEMVFENGISTEVEHYGWKCRECDHTEEDTPYCEECDFDTCPSCGYNESSEPCNEHKEKING
jgi:hypothetical protein